MLPGGPNVIQRVTGVVGGWRATYSPPFSDNIVQEPDLLTEAQRRTAILGGAHSMTFGLANDIQIADNGLPGGPAPGCEGSPWSRNAVTSFDDAAINRTSGSLVVRGQAMAGTTSANVVLRDGNATTPDVIKPALLSAGAGPKTWTVTFLRGQIHPALADGPVRVLVVPTPSGATLGKTIRKDTVAPPAPRAAPKAGIYGRTQFVSLEGQAGAKVRYTLDGTRPTVNNRVFTRPIRVASTRTIKAIAVDPAGNKSLVGAFRYVIR